MDSRKRPFSSQNNTVRFYRWWVEAFTLIVCSIIFASPALANPTPCPEIEPTSANSDLVNSTAAQTYKVFLTVIYNPPPSYLMLGVYTPGYTGSQDVIDSQLKAMDSWAGKQHSIVGLFVDLKDGNPGYNIPTQLESLYKNGYTAFLNLQAKNTMAEIANGYIDTYIHNTARAYASWAKQGGNRMAFIAPFMEMNGNWTSYGLDPINFKIGYQRVRDIFNQEGVPVSSTRWVFSPNGWGQMAFEDFYPGDASVDINAFSAYNYGYCPASYPWPDWESPQTVFGEYIQRMEVMAPTKPIFIAQTATTNMDSSGSNIAAKNQWLADTLNYLANKYYVRGLIYFNLSLECDWPIFTTAGLRYDGYPQGAQNPAIVYKSPADLMNETFIIGR